MGLCKCPKRRVTNQFCFEHRVNVCEHCMVTNHPKCIVQSYIQWLQDSDYNAICVLCTQQLGNQECLRLTCYHVFHWSCLESMFRKLPRTTAPAGYQCPTCQSALFPPSNLVSPVADVLREKLAGVNWARAGLGLSLLCEETDTKSMTAHNNSIVTDNNDSQYGPNGYIHSVNSTNASFSAHSDSIGSSTPHRVTPIGASDDESYTRKISGPPYSVVQVPEDSFDNYGHAPRKIYDTADSARHNASRFDHDDDKYKRKSAVEWLVRWWKNTLPPARRRPSGYFNRRGVMTIVIIAAVVMFIIFILMKIGRASIENDPNLHYKNNPNIHIQA